MRRYAKYLLVFFMPCTAILHGQSVILKPRSGKVRSNNTKTLQQKQKLTPFAYIRVSADMEGTIYLDAKSHNLTSGVPQKLPIPQNTVYYFVTQDEFFETEDMRLRLREHEKGNTIEINLQLADQYAQLRLLRQRELQIEQHLRKVSQQMLRLKGGVIEATPDRGELVVESFSISRYEVSVADFKTFVELSNFEILPAFSDVVHLPNLRALRSKQKVDWRYNANGRLHQAATYDHPVVNVSWQEAMAYCNWLTDQDPVYTYRLPSLAEWEFAAAGGEYGFVYPWGDRLSTVGQYANTADRSLKEDLPAHPGANEGIEDGYAWTCPVTAFEPNGFGIYNLGGNAAEWVMDNYINPTAYLQKTKNQKAYKGGSYFVPAANCKVSNTAGADPSYRNSGIGFRLARKLKIKR